MRASARFDRSTWRREWPFWATGVPAILGAGLLSGVLAHEPSRPVMWLVAYLVLVVGAAQLALAAGQARFAAAPPSRGLLLAEWIAFNAANALVVAGTLLARPALVPAGAFCLVVALALFLQGVRGARGGVWLLAYRLLAVGLGGSALVGVALALWRAGAFQAAAPA